MRFVRVNLFIAGYVLVLSLLATIAYFVGLNQANHSFTFSEEQQAEQRLDALGSQSGMKFYNMPRIDMNMMSASGAKSGTLKLALSLEVAPENAERISGYEPRIVDRVMTYMRKMSVQEIQSMTLYQLHADLLREINMVTGPIRVNGIAVRELVIE